MLKHFGLRLTAAVLCLLLAAGCGKGGASGAAASPASSSLEQMEPASPSAAESSSAASSPSEAPSAEEAAGETRESAPPSSSSPGSQETSAGASSGESSSQSQPEEKTMAPEETSGASSPEEDPEAIDTAWFDDVLFVGDSITEGIKLYDVMSNAAVLSYTGINLNNIFTKEVIDKGLGDGSKETIIDASARYDPGKIYILMGINSILLEEEDFISAYGQLVDTLHTQHPDAVIYVQSILPVTAAYEQWSQAVTDNATIDRYNQGLRAMAMEKGVYYLNVAEVFKDSTGALYDEASPTDGIHFGPSWYRKWFAYLDTHKGVAQQ